MTKETQADRLRRRRIELGYVTAADAARQRGWNERTYQSHEKGPENGGKPISKKAAVAYCASFGLSLDYLVSGKTHSGKYTPEIPQPPLDFRFVPLLSCSDLIGARCKMDVLQIESTIEPTRRALVSVNSALGEKVVAFEALDASMVAPVYDRNTCIMQNDEFIVDLRKPITPGKLVCAFMHNPPRLVHRIYAEGRHPGSAEKFVRLIALNPVFAEEIIASHEDGFILGPIVRIQTVRCLDL
jgi:hypothetical protein